MFSFESKTACHAAAPRVQDLKLESKPGQEGAFGIEVHHGFVMAVPVHQGFAPKLRKLEIIRLTLEELTQEEGLPAQLNRSFVMRKETAQLVSKYRHTTGLQTYHRRPRRKLWPK